MTFKRQVSTVATASVLAAMLSATLCVAPAAAEEFKLASPDTPPFQLAAGGGEEAPQTIAPEDQDDAFWEKNSLFPEVEPDPDALEKVRLGHTRELLSTSHLMLGGAALGMLGVAGISGIMLVRENDPTIRQIHQWSVGLGSLAYFVDGALILFAPKPWKPEKEETHFSNILLHRGLFYVHLAGMTSALATGLIATRFWGLDPTLDIRKTHPAVGTLAIGAIAASALAITLNF